MQSATTLSLHVSGSGGGGYGGGGSAGSSSLRVTRVLSERAASQGAGGGGGGSYLSPAVLGGTMGLASNGANVEGQRIAGSITITY